MAKLRPFVSFLLIAASVEAHPMGNFSVNHYSRLEFAPTGVRLTYILDLAELPTLELLQQWGISAGDSALQQKAAEQAASWLQNLDISVEGRKFAPHLKDVKSVVSDGAGGLPVIRIVTRAELKTSAGHLTFDDHNYVNRTGWKEIVIQSTDGVSLLQASRSGRDLSHGLTVYPADLTLTPPQDLHASATWTSRMNFAQAAQASPPAAKPPIPTVAPTVQPLNVSAPQTFAEHQPSAPGTVSRGDFLSRMLREKRFGPGTILIGLLVALGLGAMHALSPGHGKTIVAAYLVGSRGTVKHALFLGLMVTFTHTVTVFLLGISVLLFQKYVAPERMIPILGALSGVSIVCIGAWLFHKRTHALLGTGHEHDHAHGEHHHHHHSGTFTHTHTHDGHTHTHVVPQGPITPGALIALGASGGLVPCPSALILLLSAIALGHAALGLALLVGFSCGLALVLMAIGAAVLYAKNAMPQTRFSGHPAFQLLPIFSSVVVMILGLLMTLTAVGLVRPFRLLS